MKRLFLSVLLLAALILSGCITETTLTLPPETVTKTTANTVTVTITETITVTPDGSEDNLDVLTVSFIDVGQGDAILIDLNDIEVLIDGGDRSPGVVSNIAGFVDGALEVVVATHPHADHIGGLIEVLENFEVEQIWHNGDDSTSITYSDFMAAVIAEGAAVHEAVRGDIISAGELDFTVLNPLTLDGSTNNNSIVLSLSYGDIDFLFTGDAEQEAEADILISSIVPVPDVEILKVGHHGSNTASSPGFLADTSPEIAIYMAGEGNSYGHPHAETIIALTDIEAEVYGTDVYGTIVVTTNGITYEIQTEKEGSIDIPEIPTATITPPTTTINVQITRIFYDGAVYRTEADEYVEITNLGTLSVNLEGWRLVDISEGYPSFTFPSYNLQPAKSIRVYTNEIHLEYGGFSFGSGKAVWNNSSPDTAVLYDAQGREVSRRSY